ncbi:hypothetical protein [Nostoc sp. FACHB-110]|nr:hypothetical protein [Nostoc sp. FACHB-110]
MAPPHALLSADRASRTTQVNLEIKPDSYSDRNTSVDRYLTN